MNVAPGFSAILAAGCLALPGWAVEERLVSGFVDDMPAIEQVQRMTLMFEHLWPLPEGRSAHIAVTWHVTNGMWSCPAEPVMSDGHYGLRTHATVRDTELTLTNGVLKGKTAVAFPSSKGKDKSQESQDVLTIDLACKVRQGEYAPHIPDRLPSLPPWKKSWRSFGGTLIAGEYSATLRRGTNEPAAVKGRVVGGISPVSVACRWGITGNGVIESAAGGGMRFLARLSPRRVMPPEEAFAELDFVKTRDWRGYDGLRLTIMAPARRDDAAVAVRIREAAGAAGAMDTSPSNGVWYGVASAAFLRGAETAFDVPFQDFRGRGDVSCGLSLDSIAAIAVGVDNPMGVGDVEFIVRRIELYRSGDGVRTPATAPVEVAVDPSRRFSLNGHSAIPAGMFGVHAAGGGVWWMKDGPVPPEKEAYLRQIRPGFFRAAHGYPPDALIATVRQAGTPLNAMGCQHLWTWSRPEVYDAVLDGRFDAFLDGFRRTYDGMAAESRFAGLASDDRPSMEVSNESFMWGRYANQGHFIPAGKRDFADPAQHGYLSGPRTAEVYSKMFLAAWDGANGKDKRLRLAGPSSCGFDNDDFAHFRDYVAPIIDRCFDKVDILTEHHYGGWPLAPAASWEVAKTYCVVKHGRAIPIANTECTDIVWSAGLRAWYNLSDILECLRVCPDVAHARSIHALWGAHMGNAGETAVLTLLNALRGTRLPVRVSDPALLHVAALTLERQLVLVVFNPTSGARRLRLASPAGCTLKEVLRLRMAASAAVQANDVAEDIPLYPVYDPAECKLERVTLPAGVAGDGAVEFDLPPTTALRWAWTRSENAGGPTGVVEVAQGYWKKMFVRLKPGETANERIVWPKPAGQGRNAVLRVVTRDVHVGECKAVINGHEVPLPWSSSCDGYCTVQDIPIEPGWLSADMELAFVCAPGDRANGFTVYAASVLQDSSCAEKPDTQSRR